MSSFIQTHTRGFVSCFKVVELHLNKKEIKKVSASRYKRKIFYTKCSVRLLEEKILFIDMQEEGVRVSTTSLAAFFRSRCARYWILYLYCVPQMNVVSVIVGSDWKLRAERRLSGGCWIKKRFLILSFFLFFSLTQSLYQFPYLPITLFLSMFFIFSTYLPNYQYLSFSFYLSCSFFCLSQSL